MSRREGREEALRLLYLKDLCCSTIEEAESIVWGKCGGEGDDEFKRPPSVVEFARQIASGVSDNIGIIDGKIESLSENWSLERMPVVDRNILRIAVYEIVFTPSTPHNVVINEAVELAKKFSGDKSKLFINGILDRVKG